MNQSNSGSSSNIQQQQESLTAVAPPVASAATATLTVTETTATNTTSETVNDPEVLRLSLVARPTVHWDENVVDNEGLGRKSSKRCCIFHKQRSFGESSTDSSDYDSDRSGSSAASGGGGEDKKQRPKRNRKIARPKNSDASVPDYQRFHA